MYTNLLDDEAISRIKYERSGRMKSEDSRIENDISLLELNRGYLERARHSVLSAFIKCFDSKYGKRKISKNEWIMEKESLLSKEKYTPYIGIVLKYIDNHVRIC